MMYLLLRDNKQTGPLTLDELKAKGLKAYDLVWVEGRSAAWRYPSEIDELRPFAPAVEEQPFDRFFKKPGTSQATATAAAAMASEPAVSNTTTVKRTIYVTMPSGASKQVTREIPMRQTVPARETAPMPEASPVRESAPMREPRPVRESAPMREPGPVRESAPMREPRPVRESAPMREPRPVRESAPMREPRPVRDVEEILPAFLKHRSNRASQLLLVGFTVVALLSAGVFIGLSIQKASSRLDSLASNSTAQRILPAAQQVPVSSQANSGQPAENSSAAAATNPAGVSPANGSTSSTVNPGTRTNVAGKAALTGGPATVPEKKHRPGQKAETPKVADSRGSVTDSVAAQPDVTRHEAVHRTDLQAAQPAVDKEGMKVVLANQVSVGTNKFEVGTFGGIHNLQVTVSNRSAYSLDLVVVQVDYIQANKKTYKSENLYFRGIAPGSALMLEAPRTSRGIAIQYKITSITSKELGLSEPGT